MTHGPDLTSPHGSERRDKPAYALPEEIREALAGEDPAVQAELAQIWHAAGASACAHPGDEDVRRLGAEIWQVLEAATQEPARPHLRLIRGFARRWVAVAAAAVVLFAAGLALWLQPVTLGVPPGEIASVELPDGSRVELNSGSSLTYRRLFGQSRRLVRLDGEAFFDVRPAAEPFIVRTFNAEITVLGTEFNVRAWREEPRPATQVTLAEGSVRLAAAHDPGRAVTLKPGQMSRVTTGDAPPSAPVSIDVANALAWREGRFVFQNQPLGTILDEIERRFDVEVRAVPETLRADSIAITLQPRSDAASILQDLCEAYDTYTFRRVPGGFELTPRAGE